MRENYNTQTIRTQYPATFAECLCHSIKVKFLILNAHAVHGCRFHDYLFGFRSRFTFPIVCIIINKSPSEPNIKEITKICIIYHIIIGWICKKYIC